MIVIKPFISSSFVFAAVTAISMTVTSTSMLSMANAAERQLAAHPPHLDLELTSQEYRNLIQQMGIKIQATTLGKKPITLPYPWSPDEVMAVGVRLAEWVKLINKNRPADRQINLTSKGSRGAGIPIEKPLRYSPQITADQFNKDLAAMPAELRDTLIGDQALSPNITTPDDEFILHARKADRAYQISARWKMLIPYKFWFVQAQSRDVRGYHFLHKGGWDRKQLADWDKFDTGTQDKIREALEGICVNDGVSASNCHNTAKNLQSTQQVLSMYDNYIQSGEETYRSFFEIQNARSDFKWSSQNPTSASVPFVLPSDPAVQSFIRDNLQAEYSWNGWNMMVNFVQKQSAPYVVFVAGATPNVEGLGGNKITMDANQPITEYEVQWTIRHEFGHVLGLPDCYHEFFDEKNNEFVNYQIDVRDLMCSRAGDFNQRIFDELKSNYLR